MCDPLLAHSEDCEIVRRSSSNPTTKYIPEDASTRERPGFGIRELRLQRKIQVASTRDPCRDTRDWTKAKRARADMKDTVVKNDTLPLDILVNKKSAAVAIWQSALGLAEVTQMRGNFWRTTGTTDTTSLFLLCPLPKLFFYLMITSDILSR